MLLYMAADVATDDGRHCYRRQPALLLVGSGVATNGGTVLLPAGSKVATNDGRCCSRWGVKLVQMLDGVANVDKTGMVLRQ
jgi:hypothetical protein